MKKPYIKRFGKVSGFDVWIVDGKYVRDHIDINFVDNYGQHYLYKFIPKNEIWLGNERARGDLHFYVKPAIVEFELMAKGACYKTAVKKAEAVEKRERKKEMSAKEIKKLKKTKNKAELVHKELLKKYSSGKIKVWIVDGELVRDLFSVDFEKGGHDKFYLFIPKNEVWVDDDVALNEIKFILIHELHERKLMSKGMEYLPAHKDSNKIELYCRKNPKIADERLKFEILENNK